MHDRMQYRDDLPSDCPSAGSRLPQESERVYRVISGVCPCPEDFRSQRQANPEGNWNGVSECMARGLSVFDSAARAARLLRLPKFREHRVACVVLDPSAGRVQKSGSPNHYTWWPSKSFDPVANSEEP